MKPPKLKNVEKVRPPFPLNSFSQNFAYKLGAEIVYLLATKSQASVEGQEWEQIFAKCIGAKWRPSNVGLDDVVLGGCAWGAKTLKSKNPFKVKRVRLISGRNSPAYSYDQDNIRAEKPDTIARMVINIWNERVYAVKKHYKHLRTVVLVKSDDLSQLTVFEHETVAYDCVKYKWLWNKNNNLEGWDRGCNQKCFVWQPSGSQFTILHAVPDKCLLVSIKKPPQINRDMVLKGVGFDKSWVKCHK